MHTPFLSASCRHSPESKWYLRLCFAPNAGADAEWPEVTKEQLSCACVDECFFRQDVETDLSSKRIEASQGVQDAAARHRRLHRDSLITVAVSVVEELMVG